MFGTVAAAGIKLLATEELDRRKLLIMAVSFGTGLGIAMNPAVLAELPKVIQNIFGSAITTGGLFAVVMSLLLPDKTTASSMTDAVEVSSEKVSAGT
jgi:xanthine permease XanP